MRVFVLICVLGFLCIGDVAPSPPGSQEKDEQAIQKVLDDFRGAWNRHDMRAFSALCAEAADFIVITGRHLKGRDEILEYHDALHKGVFKDRRMAVRWKDLRFIRADVAIGHVAFEGTSTLASGDERGTTSALATVVLAKRQGRWLITAFHNSLLSGRVAGVPPSDPK